MKRCAPEEAGLSSGRLKRVDAMAQRYVDEGKLAGLVTLVARHGRVAHFGKCGVQNLETGAPMDYDTIFRIYSMTKPITTVALMMLYEQGLFQLRDPVSRFLPEFKGIKVWVSEGELIDPVREISIYDLLTHTAGLSYGGYEETGIPVDKLYDEANLDNIEITNQEMVRRIASLPLLYHPGEKWFYSVATDVVGHLVEVIAGMPLDSYFEERILVPLGMEDTAFYVPDAKMDRFAALYGPGQDGSLKLLDDPSTGAYSKPPRLLAGGHGLVSATTDYLLFCQMLLNGGELNGVRLLGRKTVELMAMNHLPESMIPIGWPPDIMHGYGFGLGFRVRVDDAQAGLLGSVGEYAWGGYASTSFFIDPREELIAILMPQFIPSGHYPILEEFRVLVYQVLVD
jgi:CubicO group peptidase (beta-lactamase class C family)